MNPGTPRAVETRRAAHPADVRGYDTERLRAQFLVEGLFQEGHVTAVYSHEDRVVIGGAVPGPDGPLTLPAFAELRAEHFCERRELGVVNIGGPGAVRVDGAEHVLSTKDVLYVGRGARDVIFTSRDPSRPARFYLVSAPSHADHPTRRCGLDEAEAQRLGSPDGANVRTLYRCIHRSGVSSSQLVLGITVLEPCSLWNTMPCHTHDRRMEVYLYFDLAPDQRVVHLMGEPDATRSLIVANEQAVISPSWSVHCGCGTASYAFVWAMAGENQVFADMDPVAIAALR